METLPRGDKGQVDNIMPVSSKVFHIMKKSETGSINTANAKPMKMVLSQLPVVILGVSLKQGIHLHTLLLLVLRDSSAELHKLTINTSLLMTLSLDIIFS